MSSIIHLVCKCTSSDTLIMCLALVVVLILVLALSLSPELFQVLYQALSPVLA